MLKLPRLLSHAIMHAQIINVHDQELLDIDIMIYKKG